MVSLLAKSAFDGIAMDVIGSVWFREAPDAQIASVAAYSDSKTSLSQVLKEAIGAAFPATNRMTGKAGQRLVWCGPDQALLIGPPPPEGLAGLVGSAAITDQSDAWAHLCLQGAACRDILARLTSIDLRADKFKTGHVARTHLGHMSAVIMRSGAQKYEVMVMRSMAQTLWHEVEQTAKVVAARDHVADL